MQVVDHVVDDHAHGAGLVVARELAACVTDAGLGAAQAGAGAAHVEAILIEGVEGGLDLLGRAALEHDVAALSMQGDQAGAMLLPDVAHRAQRIRAVVIAGRRHDAEGVELGRFRKLVGNFRETRNHAAAIAADADSAALPVAFDRFVGILELSQQILHAVGILVAIRFGEPLQVGNKARPRTIFELIE